MAVVRGRFTISGFSSNLKSGISNLRFQISRLAQTSNLKPIPTHSRSVLRYLNPDVLSNRLAGRRFDPRGLVLGNLAGSHKSPLSGFAVGFAGHREYAWSR